MQSKFSTFGLPGMMLLTFAAMAPPAQAETVAYKADLKGSEEVPAVTSAGVGPAEIKYDTATKKLTWKVTFSGLSGPATAAHFHGLADQGKSAGVVVPIAGITSPMEGSATLTDAQAAELAAGKWYINVHTDANKGGEIRSQVVKK